VVEWQFWVVERQTQVVERRSGPFRLNLTTVNKSKQTSNICENDQTAAKFHIST